MLAWRDHDMKRVVAILALLGATGCSNDYYALRIIQPDASRGRMSTELAGSDEQTLAQKRIDYFFDGPMSDGTAICAWAIKAKLVGAAAAQPATVVLLHGLGESKANYMGVAQRLSAKGLNAVLIDLRAHGCSQGQYTTYGAKEKHDVKEVLDRLSQQGLTLGEVYAFGTTLGGAVAIQYAAIDSRCRGVMAVAPYKDAKSIARRIVFFHAPTMSEADFDSVLARAGQLAHFDPADASAISAARKLTCPLLLVHGLLDLSVPPDHSVAVYDAAGGPRKLIMVTPGPEQLALAMVWEDWLAARLVELARGKLDGFMPPQNAPGAKPATRNSPQSSPGLE